MGKWWTISWLPNKNKLKFLQQQNLNTLVQTIGLRSQPLEIAVNLLLAQDVVNFGFGKRYKGLHTVWKMQFSIEHGGVSMENLLNDCSGIPIYTNLEETADIQTKCFETQTNINLCVKKATELS